MTAIVNVPIDYDYKWIFEKAGTRLHHLIENGDHYHILYDSEYSDVIVDLLENYQTAYVECVAPKLVREVVVLRKANILAFTFNGLPIELDAITESRLTGAAIYLERNPDVLELNWDIGVGDFMTMPRDTILTLADVVGAYVQASFNNSKQIIDNINAATTLDELNAIDINSGWPT